MAESENRSIYLDVHLPAGRVETHVLDKDTLVLGRSAGADILIDESEISRRHAVLRRLDNGRWIIKDCNSRNKTLLNGRPIRLHVLGDNDTLRLGSIPVIFHDPTGLSDEPMSQTVYEDQTQTRIAPALESGNADTAIVPRTACTVLPYSSAGAGTRADEALVIDASPRMLDRPDSADHRPMTRAVPASGDTVNVKKALRYRGTILAVFVLLALPGLAAVWWFVGPEYTATGKIRVRSVVPRLVFATDDNGMIPYYEYYAATQADLARSPEVLGRVLGLPAVQATRWYRANARDGDRPPLDRFLRDLGVQYKPRTEVVEVTWTGPDAQGTALVVNAILSEYVKYVRENADRVRDTVYQKIEEESHSLRGEIEDRQKAAADIGNEVGPAPAARWMAKKKELLDRMEAQLRTINQDIETAEWKQKEARDLLARPITSKRKAHGDVLKELGSLAQQIQLLKVKREMLLENLRKQMIELDQVANRAQWLAQEREAINHLKDLYASLRSRLDQKGLERNVPDTIEVLAPAFAPSRPSADRRKKLSLAVLLAALTAGFGAAFLRGRSDAVVYEADDLTGLFDEPFLGRLPLIPARRALTSRDNAVLNESVRMVRSALLARLGGRPGAAVGVTSAEAGAGKTSLAVMLARTLAQGGKKVLLVDADWRNPCIAGCFRIDKGPGLAGALTVPSAREIAVKAEPPCLSVLPAGEFPKGPNFELLADGVFRQCLQRWQMDYDLVLLDTPAVLPVADTRLLAGALDGLLMVVREKHSRGRDVLRALDDLEACGANLLGMVYIGADRAAEHFYKNPPG